MRHAYGYEAAGTWKKTVAHVPHEEDRLSFEHIETLFERVKVRIDLPTTIERAHA
jgi:hypothetical protein